MNTLANELKLQIGQLLPPDAAFALSHTDGTFYDLMREQCWQNSDRWPASLDDEKRLLTFPEAIALHRGRNVRKLSLNLLPTNTGYWPASNERERARTRAFIADRVVKALPELQEVRLVAPTVHITGWWSPSMRSLCETIQGCSQLRRFQVGPLHGDGTRETHDPDDFEGLHAPVAAMGGHHLLKEIVLTGEGIRLSKPLVEALGQLPSLKRLVIDGFGTVQSDDTTCAVPVDTTCAAPVEDLAITYRFDVRDLDAVEALRFCSLFSATLRSLTIGNLWVNNVQNDVGGLVVLPQLVELYLHGLVYSSVLLRFRGCPCLATLVIHQDIILSRPAADGGARVPGMVRSRRLQLDGMAGIVQDQVVPSVGTIVWRYSRVGVGLVQQEDSVEGLALLEEACREKDVVLRVEEVEEVD